jgi:Ribonuclease G/E
VPFILGVNSHGKITKIAPGMKMFFRHVDYQGNESAVLAFNDRLGEGFNPNSGGRNDFPSLSHNQFYSHSVRGKVTDRNEGGTYCVGCHNTVDGFANFANEYADFQAAYYNNDFANLDFNVLQQHIGQNPGNQLNSPIWVHMAAGLGSGLYLFDATGCPVNPLDNNANRQYCPDGAPAANFANQVNNVVYDLDRVVEFNGVPNANSNHPMQVNSNLRAGATNSQMSGPLGARLLQRLVDPANNQPLLLDSWLDADSNAQGGAANFVQ